MSLGTVHLPEKDELKPDANARGVTYERKMGKSNAVYIAKPHRP